MLEDHDHAVARVNDFPGKRLEHDPRDAWGDTPFGWVWPSVRISFFVLQVALLEQLLRPRLQGRVLIREKASMILGYEPYSGEVRCGGSCLGLEHSCVFRRLGKNHGRESQQRRREDQSSAIISHLKYHRTPKRLPPI